MSAQPKRVFQRSINDRHIDIVEKRERVENTSQGIPNIGVYEEGIECTPESIYKALVGCFGLLISLLLVLCLGLTAGGVFWAAQSVNALTSGERQVIVSLQNLRV